MSMSCQYTFHLCPVHSKFVSRCLSSLAVSRPVSSSRTSCLSPSCQFLSSSTVIFLSFSRISIPLLFFHGSIICPTVQPFSIFFLHCFMGPLEIPEVRCTRKYHSSCTVLIEQRTVVGAVNHNTRECRNIPTPRCYGPWHSPYRTEFTTAFLTVSNLFLTYIVYFYTV